MMPTASPAAGALYHVSSALTVVLFVVPYFSKKIHLHVECSLMAPPRMGPRAELNTNARDTTATMFPHCSVGTISGFITVTSAYIPDAPRPWNALRMILVHGEPS